MRDGPRSRRGWRLLSLTAVVAFVWSVAPFHALGAGALTTNAQPAQAQACVPDVDPNCMPPPPPGPPPGGPPPTPPPGTCVPDVGPVHAWPCPVASTEDCVYAVGGYTTCPPGHVGVSPVQVGPVATPSYDTGTVQASPPNLGPTYTAEAGLAYRYEVCAYHVLTRCFNPGP
jgi:hypothetical protein